MTDMTLIEELNKLSQLHSFKESKEWSIEYLGTIPEFANKLDLFKGVKEARFSNRGFVVKAIQSGYKANAELIQKLNQFYLDLWKEETTKEAIAVSKGKPAKVAEKVETLQEIQSISDLQYMIDSFYTGENRSSAAIPVPGRADLPATVSWIESELINIKEQLSILSLIEAELTGYYSNLSGKKVNISAEVEKRRQIRQTKKVADLYLAARKQGENSPLVAKVLSSFKHQKENLEFEEPIVSLSPSKVIGAKSVILYNTRYKEFMVLVAPPGSFLSIKGTTIQGFDESVAKSFSKRCNKPIPIIKSANPYVALARWTTALGKPSGRCGENTLIVNIK